LWLYRYFCFGTVTFMDLHRPISSVISGAPGAILHVLARSERALTGSGIADLLHESFSRAGVNKALKPLVESGIVHCETVGRANLYVLNRHHLAADSVIALAGLRTALIERIRTSLLGWTIQPRAVWLFGSAARGDGDSHSDIDLLLVRDPHDGAEEAEWSAQMMGLAAAIRLWSGNPVEFVEYSTAELQRLVTIQDPLVSSLLREAISIVGPTAREALTLQ